jgi:hypothetical protein
MQKIKIYLVTYRNEELLFRCLRSLFDESNNMYNVVVTIMNNYVPEHEPELVLPEDLAEQGINIIHNSARPSFSTGHLARSWNECVMDAIVDLKNPQCDVIVLAQADTLFAPGAIQAIRSAASRFDYVVCGSGDEIQVLTLEGLRRIGIWDERFCSLGLQEDDYFRRARMIIPDKISINDHYHKRVYKAMDHKIILTVPCGRSRSDPHHLAHLGPHSVSVSAWKHKWGPGILWDCPEALARKDIPKQYIMYPYFEKDLPDLEKKYHYW